MNKSFGRSFTKTQVKDLERLLDRRVNYDQVISAELASEMAELACDLLMPVSCLIDRNGKIRQYYAGDVAQISDLKAQKAREKNSKLAQLRLIVADPKKENVAEAELLLLKRYNFDLLLFIHATGSGTFSRSKGKYIEFADSAQLCKLTGTEPFWSVSEKTTIKDLEENSLSETLSEIEEDLASAPKSVKVKEKESVILVGFGSEDSFAELEGLTDTAGGEIKFKLKQNIKSPDPKYFIGSGKLQELKLLIQRHSADLVIFDGELSPAQARNIERELGERVKVLDRTELILDIFAQRAKSNEGKIQVELAQLKYLAPRLAGGYKSLSKLGGGIGTRGPGETKIEVERRQIKQRISYLEKKVDEIAKIRQTQRRQRQKNRLPLVSLVGYTNAGKSTIFKTLTLADVLVEDKLFATLDPTIRKLRHKANPEFLLSDTVGFIQNLPTTLVDAFKATLEEISESDLLLLTLDASHPNRTEHLKVIKDILSELSLNEHKRLLVFNKIDLVSDKEKVILEEAFPEALFISAKRKIGLEEMLDKVCERCFML